LLAPALLQTRAFSHFAMVSRVSRYRQTHSFRCFSTPESHPRRVLQFSSMNPKRTGVRVQTKRTNEQSLEEQAQSDAIRDALQARRDRQRLDNVPRILPNVFHYDSAHLLSELTRVRELVLSIPFRLDTHGPTQTVVDALFRLEDDLREILQYHSACQDAWAQRAVILAPYNGPPR
jgi:hypothetical protein